jgi:hypothetical protein
MSGTEAVQDVIEALDDCGFHYIEVFVHSFQEAIDCPHDEF